MTADDYNKSMKNYKACKEMTIAINFFYKSKGIREKKNANYLIAGVDPRFLERGFIYIKGWGVGGGGGGFALLILSHFS